MLVDACIGSGKTTAIQVLCNEMAGKSILYLTYNKLLKVDAKRKIQQNNVLVQNYHGYAYLCLARQKISCGMSDLIQTFNRVHPPMFRWFDVLVIDEYQDIEQELAEMLEYIKSCNPFMQIIAVGDMKQKIYDKTTLHVPSFINRFMGNHMVLQFTQCFRLSSEHAASLGRVWQKQINGVNHDCNGGLQYSAKHILCCCKQRERTNNLCKLRQGNSFDRRSAGDSWCRECRL